ncbi:thioesterase [Coprobacillaceae bacterium CR2/5/TPMF4]|nr:thioesterase [Coprobacillaceae bacterium CR2/5/TPMF4]
MKRQVLYSDVDVNQHMNNSRYIEWALDAIAMEVFDNKYFSEVSVFLKRNGTGDSC